MFIKRFLKEFIIWKRNIIWRKNNQHNSTVVNSIFPLEKMKVGKQTYGKLNVMWMAADADVQIGNYCSIGPDVKFLVGGEHDYRRISTFPFQTLIYEQPGKAVLNRDIVIEDDVWIGYDALILSGAHIGQGCVIGARSIVTGYVPPYSVYVGNKVIKKRFDDEIVMRLSKIDYKAIEHRKMDAYEGFCQTQIDSSNIDAVINSFCGKNE